VVTSIQTTGLTKNIPRLLRNSCGKKPTSLSYEDASTLGGVGLSTAVQALHYRLGIPKPWEPKSESAPKSLLVWAGSTSVGLFAIALAKLAGIPVVSTASPHNFELLKKLGADAVFDYKDPDVVSKIKEWGAAHGGLTAALDNISEHGSTKLVAQSLSEKGGKVIILLAVKQEGEGWPENVEINHILLYSILKRNTKDFHDIHEWNTHLPELIESGKIKNTNPLKILNGFEAIEGGLDLLRSGKMSAQKIAIKLD